jgi:hypothetical protein
MRLRPPVAWGGGLGVPERSQISPALQAFVAIAREKLGASKLTT